MLATSPFSKKLNKAAEAARAVSSAAKKRLADDFSEEDDAPPKQRARTDVPAGAATTRRRPFSYVPLASGSFTEGVTAATGPKSVPSLPFSTARPTSALTSRLNAPSVPVFAPSAKTTNAKHTAKSSHGLARSVMSQPASASRRKSVDAEFDVVMPSGRMHSVGGLVRRHSSVLRHEDAPDFGSCVPNKMENEGRPAVEESAQDDAIVSEITAELFGTEKGREFRVRIGKARVDDGGESREFRPPPANSRDSRRGAGAGGNFVRTNLRNRNFRRGARTMSARVLRKAQRKQREERIARAEGRAPALPNSVPAPRSASAARADGDSKGTAQAASEDLDDGWASDSEEYGGSHGQQEAPLPLVENPDMDLSPLLRSVFGIDGGFRPGQEETIRRILRGESALTVLPTGAGKSLCYQLPAYLACGGKTGAVAVVVSPLLALMDDQELKLPPSIRGAVVRGSLAKTAWERVAAGLRSGKLHVLFATPEAVTGRALQRMLQEGSVARIAFACVDEAHCVTEWSHNFRPSYARLNAALRDSLSCRTLLALTATATVRTVAEIAEALEIDDDNIVRGDALPPNLRLTASVEHDRDAALARLLQSPLFGAGDGGSTIVYCARQADAERVSMALRTRGIAPTCEAYHGGLSAQERKRVQTGFSLGKISCVAATVAFGMGIDLSCVRRVVHYSTPPSIEQYVQEIGRAGRDGLLAHCHAFLDPADECLYRSRCDADCPTEPHMLRILRTLLRLGHDDCRIVDAPPSHAAPDGTDASSKGQARAGGRAAERANAEDTDASKSLWEEVESAVRAKRPATVSLDSMQRPDPSPRRLVLIPSQAEFALDARMETILTVLSHLEAEGAVHTRSPVRVEDLARGGWTNAIQRNGASASDELSRDMAGSAFGGFGGRGGRGFGNGGKKKWQKRADARASLADDSAGAREYATCYELDDEWTPTPEAVAGLNAALCEHFEAMRDAQRRRIARVFGCLSAAADERSVSDLFATSRPSISREESLHLENAHALTSERIADDVARYFCSSENAGDAESNPGPQLRAAAAKGALERAREEIMGFARRNRSAPGMNGRAIACILLGMGTPRFKAKDWARAPGWGRLRDVGCDYEWIRKEATVALFPSLAKGAPSDDGEDGGEEEDGDRSFESVFGDREEDCALLDCASDPSETGDCAGDYDAVCD